VDVRIRRTVRAKGFRGSAFEKLPGPTRHHWMKSLGNRRIETRTGPKAQIADRAAAGELLDLALASAGRKRRLLFFCSCQWPRCGGRIACHRTTVAGLVRAAARKRGVSVEVVQWPGGEPRRIELDVSPQVFAAVRKGRWTVPPGNRPDLARVAGPPWCSVATLRSGGGELHRVVGPATRQPGQWVLPVLDQFFAPGAGVEEYRKEAVKVRKGWGLEAAPA
jgi:hypothetical protein